MRPSDAFDKAWKTVRQFQADQHRITLVPISRESSGGPPHVGNWRTEYIAEFALCGRLALRPWPRRAEMFEVYFVNGMAYMTALQVLRVQHYTFDWWAREIKKTVGREVLRRGLHRTREYCDPIGIKTTDLIEELR